MQLPARAVRVDALVDFVEEHDLWKVSTKEMIERLFQPSLCFLSAAEAFFAPSQLGEADVYVSHNWDSTFGSPMAAQAPAPDRAPAPATAPAPAPAPASTGRRMVRPRPSPG